MSQEQGSSTPLLGRPEPHFAEGQHWPSSGWLGRILWIGFLLIVLVTMVLASTTDMVVQVSLAGSTDGSGGFSNDGAGTVTLICPVNESEQVLVGHPVSLRIVGVADDLWGIVKEKIVESMDSHVRLSVAIVSPPADQPFPAGQGCQAKVMIGFVSTLNGLWQLAINQSPIAAYTDVERLQLYIPPVLRESRQFRRIAEKAPRSLNPVDG